MVHKRLLIEGDKGLLVQECLFDEFWEDTGGRIRALGVGELSVMICSIGFTCLCKTY